MDRSLVQTLEKRGGDVHGRDPRTGAGEGECGRTAPRAHIGRTRPGGKVREEAVEVRCQPLVARPLARQGRDESEKRLKVHVPA